MINPFDVDPGVMTSQQEKAAKLAQEYERGEATLYDSALALAHIPLENFEVRGPIEVKLLEVTRNQAIEKLRASTINTPMQEAMLQSVLNVLTGLPVLSGVNRKRPNIRNNAEPVVQVGEGITALEEVGYVAYILSIEVVPSNPNGESIDWTGMPRLMFSDRTPGHGETGEVAITYSKGSFNDDTKQGLIVASDIDPEGFASQLIIPEYASDEQLRDFADFMTTVEVQLAA